ncbi:DUF6773 family protein [Priestia filamentosa]|uniref:DUF6773 family protein n=1 Tax=Priestia filamentosa TaxID=1402861 RepID=UPI00058943F9
MKKIKKMILGIENQGDERVEALENKLLARSGLIIVALCALDFLIRGILLDRPSIEWGVSFFVVILYSILFTIQTIGYGIYSKEVEDEVDFKKQLRGKIPDSIGFGIGVAIVITLIDKYSGDSVSLAHTSALFLIGSTLCFLLQFVALIISWRKIKNLS